MGNSLTKSTATTKQTFSNFMASSAVQKKIADVIQGKDGQRFITSLVSAVSVNPKLAECDHLTIFSAALLGESLKLSPSPQLGQYYLVPYKKKDSATQAQFQLGYKGYIQLAIRSGQYRRINFLEIKKGELISYNPLTEEIDINLICDDSLREKASTSGYYVSFELINGFKKAMYWSYDKMINHADKYSQAFSADKYADLLDGKIPDKDLWKYSSFWYKNFDEMAKKTMIRQIISKWGVMSIDLQTAMYNDMAAIDSDGKATYIDNPITGYETPEEAKVVDIEKQDIGNDNNNSLLDGVV